MAAGLVFELIRPRAGGDGAVRCKSARGEHDVIRAWSAPSTSCLPGLWPMCPLRKARPHHDNIHRRIHGCPRHRCRSRHARRYPPRRFTRHGRKEARRSADLRYYCRLRDAPDLHRILRKRPTRGHRGHQFLWCWARSSPEGATSRHSRDHPAPALPRQPVVVRVRREARQEREKPGAARPGTPTLRPARTAATSCRSNGVCTSGAVCDRVASGHAERAARRQLCLGRPGCRDILG